jgi:hypothetical protein
MLSQWQQRQQPIKPNFFTQPNFCIMAKRAKDEDDDDVVCVSRKEYDDLVEQRGYNKGYKDAQSHKKNSDPKDAVGEKAPK